MTPPTFTAKRRSSAETIGLRVVDGAAREHAGIVDEDIEAPKLLGNVVHERFDLLGIGLIGLERLGAHAVVPQISYDRLGLVGGRGITDRDVGALVGEGSGDCRADTARAAGDQGDLAGKRLGG